MIEYDPYKTGSWARALTFRSPMGQLIVNQLKRIENRHQNVWSSWEGKWAAVHVGQKNWKGKVDPSFEQFIDQNKTKFESQKGELIGVHPLLR